MRRRTFLTTSAAAGIGHAAQTGKIGSGSIPRRIFGKTGEKLTIIGQAGGRFPACTYEEAKAITLRAYQLGVNYFDCARAYWNGRSEQVFGEVLKPYRKNLFLTTKSAQRSRKGAEEDLEASLRALETGYIDLWQIHQVSTMEEVKQIFAPGGAIEAFEAAKKAGKCRFIGFTGHADPDVHLAMLENYENYDTILMPLHPADPSYMSFEKKVLPLAVSRGMGIQAMKSTANGRLLEAIALEDCLGYALSLPIHCLAVGCTRLEQIEADVRVAQQFKPLAAAEMDKLRQVAARVAGPKLEDWKRSASRSAAAPRYCDGASA